MPRLSGFGLIFRLQQLSQFMGVIRSDGNTHASSCVDIHAFTIEGTLTQRWSGCQAADQLGRSDASIG
jgi:hypothetical protein